jgi:glucose/mannose-6-phosphate isomerase
MGLTEAAGFRWKTQLNENSKVTTLFNVFPELNHNELVNLGDLKKGEHNFSLVILRDKDDHPRVQKRIEITKKLLDKSFEKITEIWSSGNSKLARLMSLVMIGDYLSVYLAVRRGVDPTPVEIIEKLKKELGK